jgi:RND family efflux transporter MFP subunit
MNELEGQEERLRAEVEELKRQLAEQRRLMAHGRAAGAGKPSGRTLLALALLVGGLCAAGYYFGYLPRQRREMGLAAEARAAGDTLPVATVQPVTRASAKSSLVLPGDIQAVTEAPVLARASGYIKKRYVDIGDRVTAGQPLVEIEAPELEQEIRQGRAAVEQANAAVEQAQAGLEQGRATENLLKINAERNQKLADKNIVSRQDNDTSRLQYAAQQATVEALAKAVAAARSSADAAQANLARLADLEAYLTVRAPFAGVITVRNVDTGALVNEGGTLLFRIAQTDRLRIYLNVPQSYAAAVHAGQPATLTIPDLPGRKFQGTVARTADSFDPASRTLLTEVQVAADGGLLLPGMYAQVELAAERMDPPLSIPADTLVMRSTGPQAAVVRADGTVHFTPIQLGRDYGDHVEVLGGLEEGQLLVVNPSDIIREGVKVKPLAAGKPAAENRP